MPISCPIDLLRISDDQMRSLDYRVMAHVFATHNELGRLADEGVYHQKLLQLLQAAGMSAAIEVPIRLSFRSFSVPLAMDLVVDRQVIYELKAVAALLPVHESQLLGYLFLTDSNHGKLVNFRTGAVESRFVNSTFTSDDRRRFDLDASGYRGDRELPDVIRELMADWGTGLDGSLYRRAVMHCCSGQRNADRLLPMTSGGQTIGQQRFHLLSEDTALGLTTFTDASDDNRRAFEKLLAASPLERLHWVNVTHRRVTLRTIGRR